MFPLEKSGVAKARLSAKDNAWASDSCAQHTPGRANQSRLNELLSGVFLLRMLAAVVDRRADACKLHLAALRAPSLELWVRLPVRDLRRLGNKS
ncbi:hypothetical protein ACVWXO_001016 [Bradyrhizobium sp. LM2.7]